MHSGSNIKVAVVSATNREKKVAMNKDLNGGFGTADTYSTTVYEKILSITRRRLMNLPIVSLAFLIGIFKQRGISARYYDETLSGADPEIILIYGSIVDYKNENIVCEQLRSRFKNAKIGFIGPFPSVKPELFESGDFVIIGDFEYFFLKEFRDKSQLNGRIIIQGNLDMNDLPHPELDGFPIKRYSYKPAITKKPFFALQSSKGCPYSCSYYCVYGKFQGNSVRVRSPKKVVEDMVYLMTRYNVKGFQFRDPTFGIKQGYIEEFCDELKNRNLKVQWGIETKLELLDEMKIKLMFDVGLRNINIGIETINKDIARQNKRVLAEREEQERLIKYCEKVGVRISAFYLFGYEGETKELMESTLKYAKKLNTCLARFAVCTPYPSTEFFEELEKQGRILTYDYEKYTQFDLVIKHPNINQNDIRNMLSKAYKEYYFRPGYILKFIKWKIRGLFL